MSMNETKMLSVTHHIFTYRFSWLHLTRPMTFTGSISPILAGTLYASIHGSFHFGRFMAFIIAALLVQASVNMLNDFFDFHNGQDKEKWMISDCTSLHHSPNSRNIPYVVFGMLLLALIIGIMLAIQTNFWILVVGTFGVLFGYFYSAGPHSLSALDLGEITAAIFLGFVPTILAYVIQGNGIDYRVFFLASPFAILISTMILSNNIRDFEKDKNFRRTIAIKLGRKKATYLLTILLFTSYIIVPIFIYFKIIPMQTILVYLSFPLALRLRTLLKNSASRSEEIAGMKWAAWHHWAFGILFAIGLLLA